MYGSDKEALEALNNKHKALLSEIGNVIVGQEQVIREVTTAIFAGGHVLLVGVPGLAKTLLVNTIAQSLGLSFNRVQFTPDLMPSDIVGSEILDESRQFKFMKGPLFANIVLADEINRTPPKTQSALLEAMQERSVTVAGQNVPIALAVFRFGNAKPNRTRRHLSVTGSATGPIHVQHVGGLSDPRRRVERGQGHDFRRGGFGEARHYR